MLLTECNNRSYINLQNKFKHGVRILVTCEFVWNELKWRRFRGKKELLFEKEKQRFKVTADHRRLLTYDLRIVLLIDQQYWKEAAAIQCCFYCARKKEDWWPCNTSTLAVLHHTYFWSILYVIVCKGLAALHIHVPQTYECLLYGPNMGLLIDL